MLVPGRGGCKFFSERYKRQFFHNEEKLTLCKPYSNEILKMKSEESLVSALTAYRSDGNTYSLWKLAKIHNVSYSTLRRRVQGNQTPQKAALERRLLTAQQEVQLEAHIIYLYQSICPPTSEMVRSLAATLGGRPGATASYEWLHGFINRSPNLHHTRVGKIDIPRCRGNAESLIDLFFDLLVYYQEKFQVTADRIWDLDECGIKIGETMNKCNVVASLDTQNAMTNESGELVTILEVVSALGKIGDPLFIYRGKNIMEAWFPANDDSNTFHVATSATAFITSEIFLNWFKQCDTILNQDKGYWKILLLDGHSSHTQSDFIEFALKNQVIPLFFPSHMTHILQPLDLTCFGALKQLQRRKFYEKLVSGQSPSKLLFHTTYFDIRSKAFSSVTIKKGFFKAGIFPLNRQLAKTSALGSLNQNSSTSLSSTHESTPDISEDSSSISASDEAILSSENILSRQSISDMSWKSLRMTALNAGTPKKALALYHTLYRAQADATTKAILLEEKVTRMEFELAKLKKTSTPRRRYKNPNREVVLRFGPARNDPQCPIQIPMDSDSDPLSDV